MLRGEFTRPFLTTLLRNYSLGYSPRVFLVDRWQGDMPDDAEDCRVRHAASYCIRNDEARFNLKTAADNVARFFSQVSFLHLATTEAAPFFKDSSLGFVYVDARHDYCSVEEELRLYYPKLRPGLRPWVPQIYTISHTAIVF